MEIRLHGYVCKNSFVVSPLCFLALSSWLHRSFKHLSLSYEPGQWHSRWYLESQSEYMKHIPLTSELLFHKWLAKALLPVRGMCQRCRMDGSHRNSLQLGKIIFAPRALRTPTGIYFVRKTKLAPELLKLTEQYSFFEGVTTFWHSFKLFWQESLSMRGETKIVLKSNENKRRYTTRTQAGGAVYQSWL